MTSEITIKGESVQLVPFTPEHISDDYLSWLNDKQLMHFSRQKYFTHTRESSLEYLQSFDDGPHLFWAVELTADRQCIGTLTAYIDIHHHTADIGLMIGHAGARGKGYGLQAWRLAMKYLFNQKQIRKITGGTNSLNHAMIRIMQNAGMVQEGCQKEQELIEGEPTDILYFGLINEHWQHA
jgi:RimJ/RimL family protein N-acetyltransferase